ncbi:MAG: prolyl oligopeptidase family serine peptidase [Rhizobiales bacterium]|nr:prolyl oligopeptidase family serine peptidase [Hyphomicrobiales bacterium]
MVARSIRSGALMTVPGLATALLVAAIASNLSPASAQAVPAPEEPSVTAGAPVWVTTMQRLKTMVYESPGRSAHPVLVVVAHGDSPSQPPTYHYRFAARAAAWLPDVVAAAILRPGYSDGEDRSDGLRGETTGDNYTPEVVDAVATAISDLRRRYHPRYVVLVGHSGGAAIMANLLGERGAVADAALLVSCPCDVPAWRRHMQKLRGGAIWERPERFLSPQALVGGVAASTRIAMLVGANDQTTPPFLTEAYAEALRGRGVATEVTVAPDLEHNILLHEMAMRRLKDMVAAAPPRPQ